MLSIKKCSLILNFLVSFSLLLPLQRSYSDFAHEEYERSYKKRVESKNRTVVIDIESHSGSPPTLEFILKDPEKIVKSVSFDFENNGEIDLIINKIRNEVLFRGTPYRERGNYTAMVFINTSYGTFSREFFISFIDFKYGKDNFNFANDGKFEDAIDFVSKTVIDWAQERFGELTDDQKVVLLYIMYSMYVGNIGRCYGFSGQEVYYLRYPESLPYPYISVYTLDERDEKIIKGMDYLQNDIVFSNFLSGRINLTDPQSSKNLREELENIKDSIKRGNPIIMGYLSSEMHHSMAVYGYFEDRFFDKIVLLVANNWEREQKSNIYSEDAENIVFQFMGNDHTITWYDLTKKKYRNPDKIFAIEREESYNLDPRDFFSLIDGTKREVMEDNKVILMVEETEEAYVVDGQGKKMGFKKPDYFKELEEVSFKKIDYNFIFEIPRGKEYTLILKKRRYNEERKRYKDVNVFGIVPSEEGIGSSIFTALPLDDGSERVFLIGDKGIDLIQ